MVRGCELQENRKKGDRASPWLASARELGHLEGRPKVSMVPFLVGWGHSPTTSCDPLLAPAGHSGHQWDVRAPPTLTPYSLT